MIFEQNCEGKRQKDTELKPIFNTKTLIVGFCFSGRTYLLVKKQKKLVMRNTENK